MILANAHNLIDPPPVPEQLRYGVRVSLPAGDPLTPVLGGDWQSLSWYASAAERDEALHRMAMRHPYNRNGDWPSIQLEPVDR